MNLRKIIFELHKILGLTTGIVVFIVAITGCCWAFRDEIESLYDDYKKVSPQNKPILTPTEAKMYAMEVFPNNHVHGTLFKKADDAIEVIFYDPEPEFYQSVFLNPYTGEVIQVDDHLSGFFAFILKGHMRLWLPKEIGEQVVGASILIFMVIILSGIFLGFYICSLALILAFTGSVMSYNWMKYVLYKSLGGDKEAAFIIPENIGTANINEDVKPMDLLIPKLWAASPNAESFELHYPKSEDESIYVEVSNSSGLYYDSDFRFFDQHTLEEIETPGIYGKYEDAKVADKILRMNYDIHIGAIGGIAGKIIAFLVSLLTASLPITGILLWYGRTYKKKHKKLAEVEL